MKNQLLKCCSIAAILISNNVFADMPKIAAGANIGLPGIGIEARTQIAENVYGRLGANYFRYKYDKKGSSVSYKAELNLLTIPVMLDYHPIDNSGFRLSAGVAYNDNHVTLKATPSKPVTYYGRTYTAQEIGHVNSKLKLGNKIAPIISVGYDNSLLDDGPFSFNAELGLMYAGKPKVTVTSSGNISQARQAQKIQDIEADVNKSIKTAKNYLKFYPMISIGVKYSF